MKLNLKQKKIQEKYRESIKQKRTNKRYRNTTLIISFLLAIIFFLCFYFRYI